MQSQDPSSHPTHPTHGRGVWRLLRSRVSNNLSGAVTLTFARSCLGSAWGRAAELWRLRSCKRGWGSRNKDPLRLATEPPVSCMVILPCRTIGQSFVITKQQALASLGYPAGQPYRYFQLDKHILHTRKELDSGTGFRPTQQGMTNTQWAGRMGNTMNAATTHLSARSR